MLKNYILKRQTRYLVCLFLWLCIIFFSLPVIAVCQKPDKLETVRYQYIYDGDTIKLKDGRKIRFIGINTPEIGRKGKASQAFAIKAKNTLKELLSKSTFINLSYDKERKDKYQRTLAYVYLQDGMDVQAKLIALGLAMSVVVPPNDNNLRCYRKLEKHARKKHLGIWQQQKYQQFRAKRLPAYPKSYRFVSGVVTSVKIKKYYSIIELDNSVSIKLSKGARVKTFSLADKVVARGWAYPFKNKVGMSIYHPENIKLSKLTLN